MNALDALKAAVLLLLVGLVQVSMASVAVAKGRLDLVLVLVVALGLLRGPVFASVAGFWAGLVVDVALFQTLGLTSLLFTLAGYFAGRFGEATTRSSAHPPLIAVALATLAVTVGSAILHFMLGSSIAVSSFFLAVLVPTLALNLLAAYPVYAFARRLFPVAPRERRREAVALG